MRSFSKTYIVALFVCIGVISLSLLHTTYNTTFVQLVINENPQWENDSYPQTVLEWSNVAYTVGTLTSCLGGVIANLHGGSLVFGTGALLSAAINVVVTFLISVDIRLLPPIKFIDGSIAGAAVSGLAGVWCEWSTSFEVSKFIAITSAGYYVALLVDKWGIQIIVQLFDWHRGAFQCVGITTAVWATLWLLVMVKYSGARRHRFNTEGEISKHDKKPKFTTYPWTEIFKCSPLWVLCFVSFVFASGSTFLHSHLPSEMLSKKYIDDDAYEDFALPANVDILTNLFMAGYSLDSARKQNRRTKTQIYKRIVCAAFVAISFSLLAYLFASEYLDAETVFDIVYFSRAFSEVALLTNVIDLSPTYASLLGGIQRTFFTLGSVFTTQFMKHVEIPIWDHRLVFFVALYFVGAALYYFFGSGELQRWDSDESCRDKRYELQNRENIITNV